MSIACVIGTSALAPTADRLSSGGVAYARRAFLLRNLILPTYRWAGSFSEVVVVGEWEPGPGITWVDFPSVYENCADALLKRQAGYDALKDKTVEWVLFQHDDHLWDPMNLYPTSEAMVVAPSRWTRLRNSHGEPLNDGAIYGYVNGHACLMRPACFERGFRWNTLPPVFTWDIAMTERLRDLNLPWAYQPDLITWDVEEGSEPWR